MKTPIRRWGPHACFGYAFALVAAVGASLPATGCAKKQRGVEVSLPAPMPMTAPAGGEAGALGSMEWVLGTSGTFVVGIDDATLRNLGEARVALSDGRVVEMRPYVLRVTRSSDERPPEATSVAARMGWWLGMSNTALTQRWSATPARGGVGAADGAPVLLVDVKGEAGAPADGGVATGEVAGRPVRVRWLASVEPSQAAERVFGRALDEAALESAWVRAALVLAERSPLTRWRSRLARGVLRGGGEGNGESGAFDDPVVEALAGTIEAQWVAGLSRLASEDAVTARRVVERLCMTLDFGGGVIVPGWTPAGERLTLLINGLLEPGSRVGDALAWLDETPGVLCWVIDDAGGTAAATGRPEGTIGVANLMESPLAAWVEARTSPGGQGGNPAGGPLGGPQIVAVSPRSARQAVSGASEGNEAMPVRLEADAAQRGVPGVVHAGDLVFEPTVYNLRVPALAPGVVIGAMHADWSLGGWLVAGREMEFSKRLGPWGEAPGGGDRSTGLIYRGVDAPLERGASMPDRWLLFLEVVEAEDGADALGDQGFVRVWFGPTGRSRIVLKVMRDGRVIDESPPARGDGTRDVPRLARVVETARGWTFWLSIPPGAIESEGLLRLGVERVDRRGVRTSWPRPLLPWQREPARLGIGTATWGDR